jgi:hypothetical protein
VTSGTAKSMQNCDQNLHAVLVLAATEGSVNVARSPTTWIKAMRPALWKTGVGIGNLLGCRVVVPWKVRSVTGGGLF